MYRHAVAVFTATSAVLLASAAQATADDGTAARCGNFDAISINVSPPAPLTGTITGEDIRSLMDTIIGDSRLRGFFSPEATMPAIPGVPYIAPVPVPYAPISGPFAPPVQAEVRLNASVADSYAPMQGGPTPSMSTSTSASAAPSGSAVPSTSQSALPRPSQAPFPSTGQSSLLGPSGAAAPPSLSPGSDLPASATGSGLSASATTGSDPSAPVAGSDPSSLSPMRVMFEDLINRALTCARSTAAPGTELPPMPVIDTASVAHYLERVVSTIPAACAPAGEPAPAQRPASLLEALGVHRILDALTDNPAACALPATGTTPQDRSTPSLLSVIGVTGLLDSLFDRD